VLPILHLREQWANAKQAYLEAASQDAELFLSATDDLVALNITAQKSALTESLAQASSLLEVRNSKELLAALCRAAPPRLEKTLTYGCVFYDRMAQMQAQVWRLAELRSSGLSEILTEPPGKSANPEGRQPNPGLEAAKTFATLAQKSAEAMKTAGRQLAAAMERNVAAMTLASVQLGKTANRQLEGFLRALP
jgi:hypothetical protein